MKTTLYGDVNRRCRCTPWRRPPCGMWARCHRGGFPTVTSTQRRIETSPRGVCFSLKSQHVRMKTTLAVCQYNDEVQGRLGCFGCGALILSSNIIPVTNLLHNTTCVCTNKVNGSAEFRAHVCMMLSAKNHVERSVLTPKSHA